MKGRGSAEAFHPMSANRAALHFEPGPRDYAPDIFKRGRSRRAFSR